MSIGDTVTAFGILCGVTYGILFSYVLFIVGATWFFDVILAVPSFISYDSYRPALVAFIGLNSLLLSKWAIPAKKNALNSFIPRLAIIILGFSTLLSIGVLTHLIYSGHSYGSAGLYAVYLGTMTGMLLLVIEPVATWLDTKLDPYLRSK